MEVAPQYDAASDTALAGAQALFEQLCHGVSRQQEAALTSILANRAPDLGTGNRGRDRMRTRPRT
jgi:hypothetical protein